MVLFAAAWLDYERREAEFRSTGLEYESAVRDVLTQIAGQYSLRVVEGNLDSLFFKSSGRTLARINPQDIRALWKDRETHPVEEATRKLAEIATAMRKPDAHYQLAQAYLLLENEKDARTELRKALKRDQNFPPAEILKLQLDGFDSKDANEAIWPTPGP